MKGAGPSLWLREAVIGPQNACRLKKVRSLKDCRTYHRLYPRLQPHSPIASHR